MFYIQIILLALLLLLHILLCQMMWVQFLNYNIYISFDILHSFRCVLTIRSCWHYFDHIKMQAIWTNDRKIWSSLSYLVQTLRNAFSHRKSLSIYKWAYTVILHNNSQPFMLSLQLKTGLSCEIMTYFCASRWKCSFILSYIIIDFLQLVNSVFVKNDSAVLCEMTVFQ